MKVKMWFCHGERNGAKPDERILYKDVHGFYVRAHGKFRSVERWSEDSWHIISDTFAQIERRKANHGKLNEVKSLEGDENPMNAKNCEVNFIEKKFTLNGMEDVIHPAWLEGVQGDGSAIIYIDGNPLRVSARALKYKDGANVV